MSSTDTNQAGEDRLERACDVHRGFYDDLVSMSPDGSGCDLVCWVCHILPYKEPAEHIKELEAEVVRLIELIRTEKLKLLAVVRERVVGEDKKPTGSMIGLITIDTARNELKAEMRNKLTKLEAEL